MRDLEFMWNGGYTRRYHTQQTLQIDTVGHHTYNVAHIILWIDPDASGALLRAALKHDAAEHITGDMPAPVKRALPDYHTHRFSATEEVISFRKAYGIYEEKVAAEHGVRLMEDLKPRELWLLKFADALDGMRFCVNELRLGNRTIHTVYDNFHDYASDLLGDHFFERAADVFNHLEEEWVNACE